MTSNSDFNEINEAKACMGNIYDQADPRPYFRELKKLGYAIPNEAKPVFQKLIDHLQQRQEGAVKLLDLGCSYGVNSAILKHDLSMSELYQHWGQKRTTDETPKENVEYHKRFFANLDGPEVIEVIGLDVAENAVSFAEDIGLLDKGLTCNLEAQPVPASAEEELAAVDLVTSTGCVGYITEKSFDHLLPTITRGRQPWIANFVLRMFPFDTIEESLSRFGYVTEKYEGQTYVQRDFASTEERDQVLARLSDEGIDATGKEADGELLAEFYLSRPEKEAAELPIERLFAA